MAVGFPEGLNDPGHSPRYIAVICCCDDKLFSRAVICGHTLQI